MQNDWGWPEFEREIFPRLKLAADRMIKHRQSKGVQVPLTCSADDLIHRAVEKTLDGSRPWASDRCSLYQHLYGVIRSTLGHEIASYQNVNVYTNSDNIVILNYRDPSNPEKIILALEELGDLINFLKEIDPKLEVLVRYLNFPAEDGGVTAPSINEIELPNLKKKLRRALQSYTGGVANREIKGLKP